MQKYQRFFDHLRIWRYSGTFSSKHYITRASNVLVNILGNLLLEPTSKGGGAFMYPVSITCLPRMPPPSRPSSVSIDPTALGLDVGGIGQNRLMISISHRVVGKSPGKTML